MIIISGKFLPDSDDNYLGWGYNDAKKNNERLFPAQVSVMWHQPWPWLHSARFDGGMNMRYYIISFLSWPCVWSVDQLMILTLRTVIWPCVSTRTCLFHFQSFHIRLMCNNILGVKECKTKVMWFKWQLTPQIFISPVNFGSKQIFKKSSTGLQMGHLKGK